VPKGLRVQWLLAISAGAVVAACLDRVAAPEAPRGVGSLPIQEENRRPGSPSWDAEFWRNADTAISGYGLPASLVAGDTLHLFVSATRAPLIISVYRLGWYGGVGARLVARHVDRRVAVQAACSPPLPEASVCNWSETDRFTVDPHWLPGVYLARFADSLGRARGFPFVVRSTRPASLVVVLPFATYQAYNAWGGTNLYRGLGATAQEARANRAVKVSFARPLGEHVVRDIFLGTDYLLIRWLEETGYDVTYLTDYDYHLGRGPDPQVAWLFAGHSEYWTWPMWLRATAARDRGISLGFLGGNDIYWLIRYETVSVNRMDAPVVVCYRDAARDPLGATPGLATVLFRAPPNNTPENALVGVMGARGLIMRDPPVDLVVVNGSDPLMSGTGLQTGDHIPRVAGWEADRIVDNGATPAGIRVLFRSPYVPMGDSVVTGAQFQEATVYTWQPSGAVVFAGGQPAFARGLTTYREHSARPPLQRFLQNVLQAFVAAHTRPPAQGFIGSPPSSFNAPPDSGSGTPLQIEE